LGSPTNYASILLTEALFLTVPQGILIINVVLPEFLKLKEENNADFFKMVQTPELACELTLQV